MTTPARPILADLDGAQRARVLASLTEHVDRSGGPDACWPWIGGSLTRGYGVIYTGGPPGQRRMVKAHRVAHEAAHGGESPPVVDHLCHDPRECDLTEDCPHRRCCNPAHLAPSTVGQNAGRDRRRADTCRAGHPRTPENTYETASGLRRCRVCAAARAREARERADREPPGERGYRPRGLSIEALVDRALAGQDGDGCMAWAGIRPDGGGYASVRVGHRKVGAHRLVYEVRIGPIPDGHVVDHVCHDPATCPGGIGCPHRACINPGHLVAVPAAENAAAARSSRTRRTHCPAGHPYDDENTYTAPSGARHCRTCGIQRTRGRRATLPAGRG